MAPKPTTTPDRLAVALARLERSMAELAVIDAQTEVLDATEAEVDEAEAADTVSSTPEPIAASATSRVAARRPGTFAPTISPRRTPTMLTASGAPLPEDDLVPAMVQALTDGTRMRDGNRQFVARMAPPSGAPALGHDAERNGAIVASAMQQMTALTASGGICGPAPRRWQQDILATTARPVRDALANFEATRGAVKFSLPITHRDGDVASGVGVWSHDNDVEPGSDGPATKACVTFSCDDVETTVYVNAITSCFKTGNFAARFSPESVNSWITMLLVEHAALAERTLLTAITAGSLAVNVGQVLGTSTDLPAALGRLAEQTRQRERMSPGHTFTAILPTWVRQAIRIDMVRRAPGDDTLTVADADIVALFSQYGIRPVWSPDTQGFGVQGGGAVIGWSDTVDVLLFPVDTWSFLNGGTLDLGTIRDHAMVGTNDLMMFSETFEAVSNMVGAESFVVTVDVCSNGGYASPLDIDPCTTGS